MRILIAAVVVLYNPEIKEIIENISSYDGTVDLLIVIDNSETSQSYELILKNRFPEAIYLKNKDNLGIAQALNTGAAKALELGYQWLLTMDQDSKVMPGMIYAMTGAMDRYSDIGIISPVHTGEELSDELKELHEYIEVDSVMTSGNLLNLEAFKSVGTFNEKLFIDYVDHEYCLRLRKNGFKVLLATRANLEHNLGNISVHTIGNTTNHNELRRYYMTRNRLLVQKMYKNDFPAFCKADNKKMWKELVKICLLEKNKLKKIKAFMWGFYHYKINKFGKLT